MDGTAPNQPEQDLQPPSCSAALPGQSLPYLTWQSKGEHISKYLCLATILIHDLRRFDRDPLPSAVDTLMGSRQPVAHNATLTVEPNPLVLRVRSSKVVSRQVGADLNNDVFIAVWNELDGRCLSILQTLDGVRFWATTRAVSDQAVITVAARVDKMGVRY